MNFSGLLPHQPAHAQHLCSVLTRYCSALDASDTGTGKTYVALWICRELGIVPLVLGPKNARPPWERAATKLGVEIEYVNYEKVRGRRTLRGGVEVDTVCITENAGLLFNTPCTFTALRGGKPVFKKALDWGEAGSLLTSVGGPPIFIETGEWKLPEPTFIGQHSLSDSEWIEEVKYGSGSFIKWKNRYTMIIFDEVHRCGGGTTLQSKLLIGAKRSAKFILLLSATVADNPFQMKAPGFALGLHQLNGKFGFRPWLLRHGCNFDQETNQISLSLSNQRQTNAFAALHKEIFPAHGARMRKSEIPDFPRSKLEVRLLESDRAIQKLTGDVQKLYEDYAENARSTGLWVSKMQELELLMIPELVEQATDLAAEARIACFVSYQKTREELTRQLQIKFGKEKVGWVDGTQIGEKGARQRQEFIDRFQRNELIAIVLNSNAGGEAVSLHDPTGKVERASLITPQDSGRRLKQLLGRVDRAGGANSIQYLLYFAGTPQEETANRVSQRLNNIEMLNDADLILGK